MDPSDREILEEELRTLITVSSDLARSLSSVTNRIKIIKSHLDTIDTKKVNHTTSSVTPTAVTQSKKTSRSEVATINRSTSPIVSQKNRSTSMSPYHFDLQSGIKIEEEDEHVDDYNEENCTTMITTPIENLSVASPTQSTLPTHHQGDYHRVVNIVTPRSLNVTATASTSTSAKTLVETTKSLPGSSKKIVNDDLDELREVLNKDDELSNPNIWDIKINARNEPRFYKKTNNSNVTKNNDSDKSKDINIVTQQNNTTCSSPEPVKCISSEKKSSRKNILLSVRSVVPKSGKRTPAEIREVNRIRQARYRANLKRLRDLYRKKNGNFSDDNN